MKKPKKLTREQKEIVSGHYLNAKEWSFVSETEFYLEVIKKSDYEKKIYKTRWLDKSRKQKRSPDYGKSKRTG